MPNDYPSVTDELGRAVLAIVGIVVACALLIAGPLGWAILAALLVFVLVLRGSESDGDTPDKVNCAACGARNEATNAVCGHCGDRLRGR